MIKKLSILALALLLAAPAYADTYRTVPNPTAIWDTTTGVAYALGTPGNTAKTVLATPGVNNTWTGTNNFTGTFEIGGVTESFPASGLLVGTTDTQTLSAKILASPVITGPAPVACGSTCTVANGGSLTLLDTGTGSVATLPGATGTGNVYRIAVTTAVATNSHKVLTNPTTDVIIGIAYGEYSAGSIKAFSGSASTYHSLQMPAAGTTPSGGNPGDMITCTDVGSALWNCQINYQAGATATTPYSASTS